MKSSNNNFNYYSLINQYEPILEINKKYIKTSFGIDIDWKRKVIWSSTYIIKNNIDVYFLCLLFLMCSIYQLNSISINRYVNNIKFQKEQIQN